MSLEHVASSSLIEACRIEDEVLAQFCDRWAADHQKGLSYLLGQNLDRLARAAKSIRDQPIEHRSAYKAKVRSQA